ncbi:hypothetical protein GIB67_031032 [Kingdonia uniflora]|uniref:Uncharacterized protein n=1 Tax=Kingdonia uniflora TaxID=39325 RepID=A0A7J7NH75_9MAGN|nr:hypothetical protein GIB67_031032 [Kingdonia uniflora]
MRIQFLALPRQLSSSFPDSEHDTDHLLNSTTNQTGGEQANTTKETMSVEKLIKDYEVCSSTLRESQALRRTSSLKRISPANFSKEARLQVPDTVLQRIISLNSLDVELYKHAQHIFAEQKGRFTQKLVETEKQNVEKFIASYSFLLGTTFVLLIFLFVNLRIRSLKLKL